MWNLRRKAFFWVANIPELKQLEWQRVKFLSRWKYPQEALRLCQAFLNQNLANHHKEMTKKKPQVLIAVAAGGKDFAAVSKYRRGQRKAEVSMPSVSVPYKQPIA